MSFSSDTKKEIIASLPKNTCCLKAFFYGMLFDAQVEHMSSTVCYKTYSQDNAVLMKKMLSSQLHKDVEQSCEMNLNMPLYIFEFQSAKIAKSILGFENEDSFNELGLFKCNECKACFLQGVFISCASITDPRKEYHLEFLLSSSERIGTLYSLLSDVGMTPKIVNRRSGNGLYFKNSTLIEEMLTYLKVTQSLFSLMNVKIERDIRNNENRATNCVANNILKAVNASQKHIDAIQKLIDFGRFEALDEELQITAKLRLKYDDVSLMELAKLHEPPISKSGLNHRLKKLMDESSSLGDI